MRLDSFKAIDNSVTETMLKFSKPALRFSLAIIFIWFGVLKPLGLSPAEGLLKDTVSWLPFGKPEFWLNAIGYWEVCIGIFFLFKKTNRMAIGLLFVQMIGTFLPLVFLPEVTFQNMNPLLLTLEGQYIIKNVMIISAALVLGGDLHKFKSY